MKVTFTYACTVCPSEGATTYEVRNGEEVPRPRFPRGWRDVLGMTVCSQHRVTAELRIEEIGGVAGSLWRSGVDL